MLSALAAHCTGALMTEAKSLNCSLWHLKRSATELVLQKSPKRHCYALRCSAKVTSVSQDLM